MTRRVLLMALVLLIPVSARAQAGANEASLKVVHSLLLQAVASGNVATVSNVVHPSALGFFRESQRLVQLGSGLTPDQIVPAVAADLGQFSVVPYETTVRVVGGVGVICMTSNEQPKGSGARPRYLRSTYVYTVVQDNWKLLSWHTSDTPLNQ